MRYVGPRKKIKIAEGIIGCAAVIGICLAVLAIAAGFVFSAYWLVSINI